MASGSTPPPSPPPSPIPEEGMEVDGNLPIVQHLQQQQLPGQAPNPLLIDVILDNLFGYVDFADLSSCRSVSKQWHKVSLPHWVRKGPQLNLHLDPYLEPHDSPAEDHKDETTTVSKYLRLVDNELHSYGPYEFIGLRQYTNFEIEGDLGIGIEHQFLRLFFRSCGQRVKELTLNLEGTDLETGRAVLLSRMTPNLVKLEVELDFSLEQQDADGTNRNHVLGDDNDLGGGEEEEEEREHRHLTSLQIEFDHMAESLSVVGWVQLLRGYPNLQTLVYGVKQSLEPEAVEGMLGAISTIRRRRNDQQVLNLKQLEIGCYLNDVILTSLPSFFQNTQLALETFRLCIGFGFIPLSAHQSIHDALASQAPTLKNLVIKKLSPFVENLFQPPRMEFVESLELVGYPFINLSFLKSFPSLKSLSFTSHDSVPYHLHPILDATTVKEHLEGVTTTSTSLTTFHCHYYFTAFREDVALSSDHIRKLRRIMPNLTDLQLWLANSTLRTVCGCWPHLTRLTVVGNQVNDDGITRLAPGPRGKGMGARRKLRNLLELKSFAMKHFDRTYVDNVGPTAALTHKSFREFLLLPKLEELEVSLPSPAEFILDAPLLQQLKEQIKCFKYNWARGRHERLGL